MAKKLKKITKNTFWEKVWQKTKKNYQKYFLGKSMAKT
jgi:hypothetical protein